MDPGGPALVEVVPLSLVAVVGSLRVGSFNRAVFGAARELLPDDVGLREVPLADVPFFDGDLEADGDPPAVVSLKSAVDAADGLLVFTPEYNRSIPAVTKNAIDWLSRMPGDSALLGKPIGVVAASPGRHTAGGVREHLAAVLAVTSGAMHEPTLGLASVSRKLTDGALTDGETRDELGRWLAGFVAFVDHRRAVA